MGWLRSQAELIDRGDPEAVRLAVSEVLFDNPDYGEARALSHVQSRARVGVKRSCRK